MPTPIRIIFLLVVMVSAVVAFRRLRGSAVGRWGAVLWFLGGVAWASATFFPNEALISPAELREISFIGFVLGGFMVTRAASTIPAD
jgi:hypothetical protein